MKCPKCGFVSFPGIAHCKKCGHHLAPATKPAAPESSVISLFSGSPIPSGPRAAPPAAEPPRPTVVPPETPASQPSEPARRQVTASTPAPAPDSQKAWREEVSERVEDFRRRRARMRGEPEPRQSLEFDFNATDGHAMESLDELSPTPPAHDALDAEIATPRTLQFDAGHLDAVPLYRGHAGSSPLDSATVEGAVLPHEQPGGKPAGWRVEIILEPAPSAAPADESSGPFALPVAPLGRRFVAGVLDTLVLLMAAGIFILIFWRAGGRMSLQPLNLAVAGVITVLLVMVYFGLFTALTATTPGLLWMGLEVRNLEGNLPTPGEAFWRAFGYLVSAAALLLGFIWALVDSDGLTWHDRMSGTYLVTADAEYSHAAQPHT